MLRLLRAFAPFVRLVRICYLSIQSQPKKHAYSSRSTRTRNSCNDETYGTGSYRCNFRSALCQKTLQAFRVLTKVALATASSIFFSGFLQRGRIPNISTLCACRRNPRSSSLRMMGRRSAFFYKRTDFPCVFLLFEFAQCHTYTQHPHSTACGVERPG